jgi:hypothetical protein
MPQPPPLLSMCVRVPAATRKKKKKRKRKKKGREES